MSAPVAVDPAPPDLATGLSDLAAALDLPASPDPAAGGPVLLVSSNLQVHPAALADLAEDPRSATMALVSRAADYPPDLRVRAGRVVGVATAVHSAYDVDTAFAGALRVAAVDRGPAAAVARSVAELARVRGWTGDPLAFLLLALVRREVAVATVLLDPWEWSRADDPARGLQLRLDALTPHEVHAARLARATKADDGVTATLLHRPLSRRLTPLALRLELSPNQVTAGSVVLGLAAAGSFALGTRPALLVGALLMQTSFVLDCVDGEVARYRRAFSATGAWLDASTDRLKEFACYGGLAWGVSVGWGATPLSGHLAGRGAWWLAAALLTVQTARHTVDYTFTAVKELRETVVVALPLDTRSDVAAAPVCGDARAARAVEQSRRAGDRRGVTTVKKLLHLGIGERWLVLSLLAALGLPLLALAVLLGLALVSLGYTSVGRVLRARSWPAPPVSPREKAIVLAQVDAGALVPVRVAGRLAGPPEGTSRWLWLRPPLLRLTEYGGLLALAAALGVRDRVPAATFLLLLVVASHHYDELYRVLHRLTPPPPATVAAGLGFAGRLAVLGLLALAATLLPGPAPALARGGLWVLVAGLGMLFLVVEPTRVLREVRRRPDRAPVSVGAPGG